MGNHSSIRKADESDVDGSSESSPGKSNSAAGKNKASPTGNKQNQKNSQAQDVRDKYEILEVLGSGSFGEVREVRLKAFPEQLRAVKIIERTEDEEEEETDWSVTKMWRKEVLLLQNLKHPHIVRFWDVYSDQHFLYVVMDLCRGGEVFSMIVELKRFTQADAACIGKQMASAIDYIHKKSIMHRDIKAENFLLADKSPTSTVQMIDFGMAAKFEHGEVFSEMCGSPHYLAPELIGQKYNHLVDLWAVGVLLYLMMYGHYPFDAKTTRDIMVKVLGGKIKWQTKAQLSVEAVHFLEKLLDAKPRRRMTAEDALAHPFIGTAGNPDADLNREPTESLHEIVRSAQRKMSQNRKKVDPDVEKRRRDALTKIDKDFKKGIRLGMRLGEEGKDEEFMTKPEFVRRNNKLFSAPSKQVANFSRAFATAAQATMGRAMSRRTSKVKMSAYQKEEEPRNAAASSPSASSDKNDKNEAELDGSSRMSTATSKRAGSNKAPQRKVKQALTARGIMTLGNLQQEEVAELRDMWQTWKQEQDAAGSEPVRKLMHPDAGARKMTLEEAVTRVRSSLTDEQSGGIVLRAPIGKDEDSTPLLEGPEDSEAADRSKKPKVLWEEEEVKKDSPVLKEKSEKHQSKKDKKEKKSKSHKREEQSRGELSGVLPSPKGDAPTVPLPGATVDVRAGA